MSLIIFILTSCFFSKAADQIHGFVSAKHMSTTECIPALWITYVSANRECWGWSSALQGLPSTLGAWLPPAEPWERTHIESVKGDKGGVSEDTSSLSFPSEHLSRSEILCRCFRHHWPRSELGWQEPDTWSVQGSINQECEPLGTRQGTGQSDLWDSVSLTLLQPPQGFGCQGQRV